MLFKMRICSFKIFFCEGILLKRRVDYPHFPVEFVTFFKVKGGRDSKLPHLFLVLQLLMVRSVELFRRF